jgi:hypothetical protein
VELEAVGDQRGADQHQEGQRQHLQARVAGDEFAHRPGERHHEQDRNHHRDDHHRQMIGHAHRGDHRIQ